MEPGTPECLKEDRVLEEEPLARLESDERAVTYRHQGSWQPIDTYRESKMLNELWNGGRAPWKVW